MEYFQEVSWTEPIVSRRGLKRPVSMQAGMLDFNPACVQPAEVSKFCSANNRIQRFAIVEWSIMNPEKIVDFFDRMRKDSRFRNYYNNVYDPLRIVYKMLFDEPLMEVGQSESQWSTKLERVLVEERQALERCREEIFARESRVAWLKHVQADELGDRYYWRTGLKPLPRWKSKTAQHAAKRKANAGLKINQTKAKKSKDDLHPDLHPEEEPVLDLCSEVPENEECVRRVILLSEGERSRLLAEGSGLTLATCLDKDMYIHRGS